MTGIMHMSIGQKKIVVRNEHYNRELTQPRVGEKVSSALLIRKMSEKYINVQETQ